MKVSQNLNVQLTQKLTLSHEMLQSLELIQLPVLELKEKIEQEVMENPALELVDDYKKSEDVRKVDTVEEVFDERDSYYADYAQGHQFGDDDDAKRMFLEGAVSRKEGLRDWLIWQLNLLDTVDEKQKEIGRTLVSFIDRNGFFEGDLALLFPDNVPAAEEMLEVIQTFDPPGVGSRNVQEALLFQIESLPEDMLDMNAYVIIKEHFSLMLERKDSQIAKLLKITNEDVKLAFEFISQFEPYPGRAFDDTEDDYIVPDAFVYKRDNELLVEINEDVLPSLTVSKYLEKIASEAKEKKKQDAQRKYVTEKVNDAKKFINIINHRNTSLFKMVLAVVKFQEQFFYKGPKFLVPLTMKVIGDEIGLSESTISRLASSKYIQTEWGVHELKYFFTNAIKKDSEDAMSSESVREMIKEIIEAQGGAKISDQKISDILQNRGVKIARRTVAKYRNILNILPSGKRNI